MGGSSEMFICSMSQFGFQRRIFKSIDLSSEGCVLCASNNVVFTKLVFRILLPGSISNSYTCGGALEKLTDFFGFFGGNGSTIDTGFPKHDSSLSVRGFKLLKGIL